METLLTPENIGLLFGLAGLFCANLLWAGIVSAV